MATTNASCKIIDIIQDIIFVTMACVFPNYLW